MKVGQKVKIKATNQIGTLSFVDNPWNLPDGTPADRLCRVSLPHNTFGEWVRASEIELNY